ncbi:tetratricopeptide repeat protein [Polaribacter gangjinensis]|uniref:Signal transduction histidine kinase internal region domain-containing protein n=1 Tax=Polaribacter gangjinensis TaxID=574710 RepID=A0A2S7WA62_9FLAO|nr:tetratricopeptide repeat protein [Polaribacter gangjinensis]PQJ74493.1 hypothetical protein BTO13_04075 [Polaribacter gangjinensis]
MKKLFHFFFFISISIWSQSENEFIKKYSSYLKIIDQKIKNEKISVESNIQYFDSLLNSFQTKDYYLKNVIKLYKASQERRINPKKAQQNIDEVSLYIAQNPTFIQLELFKNSIEARIEFEINQNCEKSYKIYDETINKLAKYKQIFSGWNISLESKTGIINSLLCLQKDQEALEYLKQLEKEIDPKTQFKEYVYVLNVSGYIHTKFLNYVEGEKYFKKAVSLLENNKNYLNNYLAACNNLAHIYKSTNKTTESIQILEKALIKAKQINDINSILLIQNNLGFLYIEQQNYLKAEQFGLSILKIAKEKEFKIHKANANRLLGTAYYNLGDYKKSEKYLDEAIAFFRNFKNPELLRNTLDIKNKLFIKTEKFEAAAIINAEIIGMLDSVNLSKNVQNLQRELVAFETEKKNNEITILKQNEEIINFKMQQQQQQIQFLVLCLILILIFGGIIFWYQKKINKIKNFSLRSKLTRSQFNPHYINNAFTALQAELVNYNFNEHLIDFTSNISRFSRLLLESTFKDEWTLFEEKQMIENYLKTQQYRLQNGFQFHITSTLKLEEFHKIKIPSAITQAALENAIEHGGFKSDSNDGIINIHFTIINNQLLITINNNIIGEPIPFSKKLNNEPSRGLDITKQRINLHSKIYKSLASFNFIHLKNEVKVEFYLPIISI